MESTDTATGLRSHSCGELRTADIGEDVALCGWVANRRDHGGVAFVDLRDASGIVQVVIEDEAVAHPLRSEFCLRVVGRVRRRPDGNDNPNLPTGDIEVAIAELEVLSESAPLPFPIEEHEATPLSDAVRYKYRYLDLRRSNSAAALRLRSEVNRTARDVLHGHDFVEIETPTLTRSTPEGARDFLVPARLAPGSWYALPQSPQLFKQILMMAGFDRYYQIARCFRDEDLRADRQPEFTQLDMEFAFVEEADIQDFVEDMMRKVFREVIGVELADPFPRMTWHDAMHRFGSDKPDLRFDLELVDVAEAVKHIEFKVFAGPANDADGRVAALRVPGGAERRADVALEVGHEADEQFRIG